MNMMRNRMTAGAVVMAAMLACAAGHPSAGPARLKDIASLQGTTAAPLLGYGLVVGLNKTGDKQQTLFTTQTLANLLARVDVQVPGELLKVENVAAVMVTSELPAFARAGARLDVTVSSIGDARSLQGGTLMPTLMRSPSGDSVGIAQGPLSIGGFGGGSGGTSVQVNHLTVGRVPGGAIIDQKITPSAMPTTTLTFALRDPDFVTANNVVKAINASLKLDAAKTVDSGTVTVTIPDAFKGAVSELMAQLDDLPVESDTVARVVINERTGTVVVGGDVRIGPAAVAHGNLAVRIATKLEVSQPNAMSYTGTTQVVPNTRVDVQEGNSRLISLEEGTTLDAVTRALNALGASPRDIIAIMQALKAAGALRAEIIIL
jgi:flagellar P-ring protein precursor FlgI